MGEFRTCARFISDTASNKYNKGDVRNISLDASYLGAKHKHFWWLESKVNT